MPKVDAEFEEITEGEEENRKQKLKTKWAALEALVGSEKRIRLIAEDFVQHFERRLEAMDGKAMVVCMSRRISVDLRRITNHLEMKGERHLETSSKHRMSLTEMETMLIRSLQSVPHRCGPLVSTQSSHLAPRDEPVENRRLSQGYRTHKARHAER